MSQSQKALPASPNLEHLRHQARDLRRACAAGDSTALARARAQLGTPVNDKAVRPFTLSTAQLVIAREHGFPSWPRLKAYIERISPQPRTVHRPLSANADYYEGRAAGIVTAFHDELPQVIEQVRELYPQAIESAGSFDIAAAREVIAREHGFVSWKKLKRHLDDIRAGRTAEPFLSAMQAIENGDRAALEAALRHDPSLVNAPGTNGNNLLGIAASCRKLDMVQLLLGLGANVNSANRYGWTALHQAGYSNNVELARLLLETGAATHLSARGEGGTPLVAALFWGHREAADLLAERAVEPGNLRAAAGAGRLDLVTACFKRDGSLTTQAASARGFYRPHGGFPVWAPSNDPQEVLDEAFVYAAKTGQLEVLEFLLRHGANIDADPYRGTALIWAASVNRPETVAWLLEHGATINLRATFGGPSHGQGVTALQIAAQSGHTDTVRLLLAHGADPTLRDDLYNGPAAGWAASGGHEQLSKLLEKAAG